MSSLSLRPCCPVPAVPALSLLTLITLLPATQAHSDSNGMDMDMDGAMALASGSMTAWLHFTPGGDTLWFQGWVPGSTGAVVGACIGLFLLGIMERWVAVIRAGGEGVWRRRAHVAYTNQLNAGGSKKASASTSSVGSLITLRTAPPFVPAHDIARGVIHAGQAALGFVFMLAVMTFNVGFILSIVVGLGVGETLFGRYISAVGGGYGH